MHGDSNKFSDVELLCHLKNGNHAAYEEIYNRYNGPLYIFAYKRLKNREEAKDAIHELFLKLWSDREMISAAINLPAYLYTALRNRILNTITHQKVAGRYIDSFQKFAAQLNNTDTTDHLIRHNELNAFIENEISNLHPRMRMVFEMSRKTNLSRKEIAEQLSISEETVKSHMHGALKILKVKLGALFTLILFFH
jgi:RNA polymerase sigma-70 factor (family 1)